MDFSPVKEFMDFMAAERTPGNAIEIYSDGKKVFEYASGYADLENEIRLTGKELYFIYSCSKVATATAGMQLIERGKILPTDPLYDYIPEFKNVRVKCGDGTVEESKSPITIGDLFSMTSGFSYDYAKAVSAARACNGGIADTKSVIRHMAEIPLEFEPGTHWMYGMSHDILAEVIAVVSGMRFSDYMCENIFEPLQMNDTGYSFDNAAAARMAEQYEFVPHDGKIEDIVKAQSNCRATEGSFSKVGKSNYLVFSSEYESGGAGIITTVSDYAKFAAALANNGLGINGERILLPRTVSLMKTNRLNDTQLKDFCWRQLKGYGYGFGVRTMIDRASAGSLSSIGEFGWGGAAGSTLWVDTDLNLGVFYAQHCLNPREEYYQPRLRNIIYSCIK